MGHPRQLHTSQIHLDHCSGTAMDLPEDDVDLSFAATTFEDEDSVSSSEETRTSTPPGDVSGDQNSSSPAKDKDIDEDDIAPSRKVTKSIAVSGTPTGKKKPSGDVLVSSVGVDGSLVGSLSSQLSPTVASSPRVRSRPRSRSRSKHTRTQETHRKDSDTSTVVLVRNLIGGRSGPVHSVFRASVKSEFEHDVKNVMLTPEDDFGFVETTNAMVAKKVLIYCSTNQFGGTQLTAELCDSAKHGRDPALVQKYGEPTRTVVVKNLPFDASAESIADAVREIRSVGQPTEVLCRLNSNGAFCGMAYVGYASIDEATSACAALDGASILGRQIRVEFKRQDAVATGRVRTMSVGSWRGASLSSSFHAHSLSDMGDNRRLSVGSPRSSPRRRLTSLGSRSATSPLSPESKRGSDRNQRSVSPAVGTSPWRPTTRQGAKSRSPEHYGTRPRSYTHTGAPESAVVRMPRGPDGTKGFASRMRPSNAVSGTVRT